MNADPKKTPAGPHDVSEAIIASVTQSATPNEAAAFMFGNTQTEPAPASSEVPALTSLYPSRVGSFNGWPVRKQGLITRLAKDTMAEQAVNLFPGLYPAAAQTGVGKSITLASIIDGIARLNDFTVIVPLFLYMYEEGAPDYVISAAGAGAGSSTLASFSQLSAPFREPAQFVSDLEAAIASIRSVVPRAVRLVLAIDSITLAVKAYDPRNTRSKGGTFAGGVQPMDAQFFVDLGAFCNLNNITMIAAVNVNVVPIDHIMEALVEGVIRPSAPGVFTVRSRGTGRSDQQIVMPPDSVARAAALLNYPKRQTGTYTSEHPFNRC